MIDEERKIIVTDAEGNTKEMEIMFTFPYNSKNFVVYFDPNAPEEEVNIFASLYNEEDGTLSPIEDDADWDVVEEMVNSFVDEENEEEVQN